APGRSRMSLRQAPVSLVALAALAAVPAAHAARGGPDAGGWSWADSKEPGVKATVENPPSWQTIAVPVPGEAGFTIPPSFPFTLSGTTSTSAWLSSNGWMSFVDPNNAPVPLNPRMPDPGVPNATLAFLWDDLDTVTGTWARHGATPNGHVIGVNMWD